MILPMLITVVAAIAAFASVIALSLPLLARDRLSLRLKAVSVRRSELAALQRASLSKRIDPRTLKRQALMQAVIVRLKLQKTIEAKELKSRLARAGWKGKAAPLTFVFCQVALPALFLFLGLFYAGVVFSHYPPASRAFIILLAMAIGAYLPTVALTNAIQKRQALLRRAFPDAVDLLVICVDAGLSIESAVTRVVDEMARTAPDLSEEFGLCAAELAFLGERRQAWENLAERTGLAEIRTFATTLIQSEKYGTPISQGLKVLAQENREARMAAAEKKAAALPAKLTVPMIIFFLPVLFMVIIGPAAIQVIKVMH